MPRPKTLWGTVTYGYDENGNQTKMVVRDKGKTEEITSFAYDYENRLSKITYDDGTASEYLYDGVGKRIRAIEDGREVNYLYDGLNVIIEQDASGFTTASYTRGLGYGGGIGSIISATTHNPSPKTHYYHYDGIGGVTELTDSKGETVQSYTYDAYGNLLRSKGDIENLYRFSTKELLPKSGLIYFGARYYDPRVGRWITPDQYTGNPIKPISLHRYIFVEDNPINFVDLWGFYGKDVHYEKTLEWAKAKGISEDKAEEIAKANQGVDEGWTSPVCILIPGYGLYPAYLHFSPTIVAEQSLKDAIARGDKKAFGMALHIYQDSFSHKSVLYSPILHLFFMDIDKYGLKRFIKRDDEMREGSIKWLEEFAKKHN